MKKQYSVRGGININTRGGRVEEYFATVEEARAFFLIEQEGACWAWMHEKQTDNRIPDNYELYLESIVWDEDYEEWEYCQTLDYFSWGLDEYRDRRDSLYNLEGNHD